MQKTNIEYLTHTWNPIAMRCTPCSPGCENCWHLRRADRLSKNPVLPEEDRKALAGEGPFILRERELSALLRARKPAMIGVQFMGDLFHEDVPDIFVEQVYDTIFRSFMKGSDNTYLMLTKRPKRMLDLVKICHLTNVWHGLTVCNQQEADEKIPVFLQVPGKKILSIEPMLSYIETPFLKYHLDEYGNIREGGQIDAVILGGESGPGARPMHPDWVRSVRNDCAAAGVDFFFKQWGEWAPNWLNDDSGNKIEGSEWMDKMGRKAAGRLLDGRTHDELAWVKG